MNKKTLSILIVIVIITLLATTSYIYIYKLESDSFRKVTENLKQDVILKDMLDDDTNNKDIEKTASPTSSVRAGSYVDYNMNTPGLDKNGTIVLFFKSNSSSDSAALDKNIQENLSKIPGNIFIMKVNYELNTELKDKYNVTEPNTFIQTDSTGKMQNRWQDTFTLLKLVTKVQPIYPSPTPIK